MKKCINRRCNADIEDDFRFCPRCGKPQERHPAKPGARRAKGSGSVYYRKDLKTRPYAASKLCDGKRVYIGNYATKTEALAALQNFEYTPITKFNITLEQLHAEWQDIAFRSLGESVKQNYTASWIKLKPLYGRKFRDIRTGELQAIIDYYTEPHQELGAGGQLKYLDSSGRGTYTVTPTPKISDGLKFSALHKIKCLLTSMYGYALQNDIVGKNYAEFIKLPPKNETNKSRFTEEQLEQLRSAVGVVPYADYILAMCYLNFRVSEFLSLTAESYHESRSGIPGFVGGGKTDAGTNRLVPIHPRIAPIVRSCLEKNGETIFCDDNGQSLTPDRFRKQCFYPAIAALGFPDDLTPHSCRRTFSTRMSAAGARQEDIIALMGHTSFDVDIDHYINQEIETLYKAITRMA